MWLEEELAELRSKNCPALKYYVVVKGLEPGVYVDGCVAPFYDRFIHSYVLLREHVSRHCKDLGGSCMTFETKEDALASYAKVYGENGLRRIG
jgi:hypothetical protein